MKRQIANSVCVFLVLVVANCSMGVSVTVGLGGGYDYSSIQAALDVANNGDTITVFPGTYRENVSFAGKNVILKSPNPDNPAIVAQTIIDGGGTDSTVTFAGTEDSSCLLSGFTITGGLGSQAYNVTRGYFSSMGGGISGGSWWTQTQAAVTNCVISGNQAEWGAGVSFFSGTMQYCTVENNITMGNPQGGGAGICASATPTIRDTIIRYNTSNYAGGAISSIGGILDNCLVQENSAVFAGGAINHMPNPGEGFPDAVISNCTIVGNVNSAIYNCFETPISHCIIWDNEPLEDQFGNSTPVITYSCVEGAYPGEGNIDTDPLFQSGPAGPYSYSGLPGMGFDYIPEPYTLSLLALGGLMAIRQRLTEPAGRCRIITLIKREPIG